MKKEDLRKVKITEYTDGTGEYDTNGYFHKWVKVPGFNEEKPIENTKALIELEDGKIRYFEPLQIKFVENFGY